MARRAMALWVNDSLDEWRERCVDDAIDLWSDAIARDHHGVARLPGRPAKLLDHMSRAHHTPVEVLRDVVAKLLRALEVFRPGDVLVGRVDGLSVLRALRDYVREHGLREIPLASGELMKRHGGTADVDEAPALSHGVNGKPREKPDEFDDEWRGSPQPTDVELVPVAPPAPRWRVPRPEKRSA